MRGGAKRNPEEMKLAERQLFYCFFQFQFYNNCNTTISYIFFIYNLYIFLYIFLYITIDEIIYIW